MRNSEIDKITHGIFGKLPAGIETRGFYHLQKHAKSSAIKETFEIAYKKEGVTDFNSVLTSTIYVRWEETRAQAILRFFGANYD